MGEGQKDEDAKEEVCLPATEERRETHRRAFVIEDTREACADLRRRRYICDRITHTELMTQTGTTYLGNLIHGDYALVWISTPADWYVRTPGKRMGPHWGRVRTMLTKARALKMHIIIFGPPGYIWNLAPIKELLEDLRLTMTRMRLCAFSLKFDQHNPKPSGTYLQVATT